MKQILEKLKNKQDLTFEESKTAFEILRSFNFLPISSPTSFEASTDRFLDLTSFERVLADAIVT